MPKVIETRYHWLIKCPCPCGRDGFHEIPRRGLPGKTWTFNGNFERPTFTPSMNECINGPGEHHNPDIETRRCHYVVTDGKIIYQGDCTHALRGQTLDLLEWDAHTVAYYAALEKEADEGWE